MHHGSDTLCLATEHDADSSTGALHLVELVTSLPNPMYPFVQQ